MKERQIIIARMRIIVPADSWETGTFREPEGNGYRGNGGETIDLLLTKVYSGCRGYLYSAVPSGGVDRVGKDSLPGELRDDQYSVRESDLCF